MARTTIGTTRVVQAVRVMSALAMAGMIGWVATTAQAAEMGTLQVQSRQYANLSAVGVAKTPPGPFRTFTLKVYNDGNVTSEKVHFSSTCFYATRQFWWGFAGLSPKKAAKDLPGGLAPGASTNVTIECGPPDLTNLNYHFEVAKESTGVQLNIWGDPDSQHDDNRIYYGDFTRQQIHDLDAN